MIIDPAHLGSGSANWPLPDRDVALERLSTAAEGEVGLVAVFGTTSVDILHVSEEFGGQFDSPSDLRRHLRLLASTLRSEFATRGLLGRFRPPGTGAEYTATRDGDTLLVQVYCGKRGMLCAVDAEEPVEPIVQAACELLSI